MNYFMKEEKRMDNITILKNIKLESFGKKGDEIEIEGALFLTYSIESRTILSSLISMFTEETKNSNETDNKIVYKSIIDRWKELIKNGMGHAKETETDNITVYKYLQEHIGFVCNDGNDKSVSSPVYDYSKGLVYYFSPDKGSFHPKVFVIRFRRNGKLYFRFMIGSMNFVNSKNKEMITVIDAEAYENIDVHNADNKVQCNILSELLNLDKDFNSGNILNMNNGNLKNVIKNLGLHEVYFDKAHLPQIITFPNELKELKNDLKESEIIVSPFLSKSFVGNINSNVSLYTMESELKKLGYIEVENKEVTKEEDVKKFFVYCVKEGEKAFSHIKLYLKNNKIYLGSLNYTESAFEYNKEILTGFTGEDTFIQEIKDYLKENYKEKTFVCKNNDKENTGTNNKEKFKNVVQGLVKKMHMYFEEDNKKIITKIDEVDLKEILKEIPRDKFSNIQIKIAPFSFSNLEKVLMENYEIKGNELEWIINNRVYVDNYFTFFVYLDNIRMVQVHYHLKIDEENEEFKATETEFTENMMLYRLSNILECITPKTINKENFQIENGNIKRNSTAYLRKLWPTLENILQKNMNNDKIDVMDMKNRYSNIILIKKLLDSDLTEEEKKYVGFGYSNKKMIDNLINQGKLLMEELMPEKNISDGEEIK